MVVNKVTYRSEKKSDLIKDPCIILGCVFLLKKMFRHLDKAYLNTQLDVICCYKWHGIHFMMRLWHIGVTCFLNKQTKQHFLCPFSLIYYFTLECTIDNYTYFLWNYFFFPYLLKDKTLLFTAFSFHTLVNLNRSIWTLSS